MPIIGVVGSGTDEHRDFAEPLGKWLAEAGYHLLTGGGAGTMTAVSRSFTRVPNRKGVSIGVLPCANPEEPELGTPGYPNHFVEVPLQTHLHLTGKQGDEFESRNHIIVLSADVMVALPGAYGTSSEVHLAMRYVKPIIVFSPGRDAIPDLPPDVRWTPSLGEVRQFVRTHLERFVSPLGSDSRQ